MNKFTLIISSLFNKVTRLPMLDFQGKTITGQYENGPLSCQLVDICMEGHLQASDLTNTKTFGSLFKTNQIVFKDINELATQVASQYERPSDPLLTSSVLPFISNGVRGTKDLTNNEDTVFTFANPDKPIRHAKASRDGRDISFISLCVRSPREKASLVFD